MRVISFSRYFPVKHSRKGESTYFPEAILTSLGIDYTSHDYYMKLCEWNPNVRERLLEDFFNNLSVDIEPKVHTIRKGFRWDVGDMFSPRVWSGKPYSSKQIQFAPAIKVRNVWKVDISFSMSQIMVGVPVKKNEWYLLSAGDVARNDGLDVHDFIEWFKNHNSKTDAFRGQIIAWSEKVNYNKNEK